MGQELREYQQEAVRKIFDAWKRGARSVLAVSPTGSGKTTIFSWIGSETRAPVLINVHRRELAKQAARRFIEFGTPFGYVMANERPNPLARVQIASVPTLVRRLDRAPRAGLVVNDEAHLSTADTWAKVLNHYQHAKILGVTATPWRLSGKPLASQYDALVVVAQPAELCAQGFLSPYVGYSYRAPDLSGVSKVGDEYNEKESAAAMRAPGIVKGIVEEWLKHARELSTIVFAVTREHSRELTEQFVAAGIRAEHLDGETPSTQRDAILARVENGTTQVLCNVGVAVEGLDIPRVKCIVLARPTMSLARAIQMMGRGRRPWRGVTCRIHDHAFVIPQHGLPDDARDYTLHAKRERPPVLHTCGNCAALFTGNECPACFSTVRASSGPGEREEVQEIDDAQRFEFGAEAEARYELDEPQHATQVSWSKPGIVVEGVYKRKVPGKGTFGPITLYLVQKGYRGRWLPGTAQLDKLFARVEPGARIRVAYVGETALGGHRTRKEFRLEVDREATLRAQLQASVAAVTGGVSASV